VRSLGRKSWISVELVRSRPGKIRGKPPATKRDCDMDASVTRLAPLRTVFKAVNLTCIRKSISHLTGEQGCLRKPSGNLSPRLRQPLLKEGRELRQSGDN